MRVFEIKDERQVEKASNSLSHVKHSQQFHLLTPNLEYEGPVENCITYLVRIFLNVLVHSHSQNEWTTVVHWTVPLQSNEGPPVFIQMTAKQPLN